MEESIPRQIGRYKIIDEIGRGGFGRVYRAFDESVSRDVAVKILLDATKDDLVRFRREATVLGNLQHENIVTVYEYGVHQGKPFIAMEYLRGKTLQEIISSRCELTLLEKCTIMIQVAEGLNRAHRSGIVHRDVKPANIMVMPDGTVKIMDFGIARVMADREATLTQQGYIVGTIKYVSPEQFSGSAKADARSDVFSYGVVFYELATGVHPFQGADSRILMYNISFLEPAPVRQLVADFPDALQEVISKALKKDRELRYQTLTAVVFDLKPVRLELERQRAEDLRVVALRLFENKQPEQALVVVLEALGCDPSNRVARALWERVQKELERVALQPRIDAHIKAGEEHLVGRRFAEAVQSFEAAKLLDSDDVRVQEGIQRARDSWNRSQQAQSLLAESRKQYGEENLTGALQKVVDALRTDPALSGARDFQNEIEAVIERRRRDQLIADAVQEATGLLLLEAFNDAKAALTKLGTDAEVPEVQQLLDRIRAAKDEEQRRQRLRTETALATQWLQEGRLAEAVKCLENLDRDFAGVSEVTNLLSYARTELESQTRARAVEKFSAQIHALVTTRQFDAALSALAQMLTTYPGETQLIRLLGSVRAAKDDFEREKLIAATRDKCAELHSRQRFSEAIEVVETTLREYPGNVDLSGLLRQLEVEWDHHRKLQAVAKAAEKASLLLNKQQPERAIPLLQQVLTQFPEEPTLIELLNRAQDLVEAQERLRSINALREETARLVRANEFQTALAAIDRALETWAQDANLVGLRDETMAKKREFEHQRAINNYAIRARQLMETSRFQEATNLILTARKEFPDDASLLQLAGEIADRWEEYKRHDSIRQVTSEYRVLISRGRLNEAIELLEEGLALYPDEPKLSALNLEARQALESRNRAATIQAISRQTRELITGGRFQEAIEIVDQGLQRYPGDIGLEEVRASALTAKATHERISLIAEVIDTATNLAAEDRFQEAQGKLETALKDLGQEPALLAASGAIKQAFASHERRLRVARTAAEVTNLLNGGQPEEALELLRGAASRYGDDDAWPTLISRAEAEVSVRKRAEERARDIREVETRATDLATKLKFDLALEMVARMLEKHLGDPALEALRNRLNAAAENHKRAEEARKSAKHIESLIGKGQFEVALNHLSKAKEQHPEDAAFDVLQSKAKALLDVRRGRDAAAREGEARIANGQFGEAITLLQKALEHLPGDPVLNSVLERAHVQEAKRQERENAINRAITATQALAQQKRYAEALKTVNAALKQLGNTPHLEAIRGEMRMRKALTDAEALIAQSKPADALKLIQEEAAEFLDEPDVIVTAQRAREQNIAQERAAAVAEQVRLVRRKAEVGDLDAALTLVEAGLRKWPDAGPLSELQKELRTAKSSRERKIAIEDALRKTERIKNDKGGGAALKFAQDQLRKFPDEPTLSRFVDLIKSELLEEDKRQHREQDLLELSTIAGQIASLSAVSGAKKALARVQQIVAQHSDAPVVLAKATPVIDHLTAIVKAEQELNNGNFDAVLDICSGFLSGDSRHVIFSDLKAETESRLKAAFVKNVRQRISQAPSIEERIGLLEEALRQFPSETWAADELRINRNKLSLLTSTLEKARVAEVAGDWDGALEQWSRVLTIHDGYPNLDAETARVRSARARAQQEKAAKWVQQVSAMLNTRDLHRAGELLRQAQSELPDDVGLENLSKQLEELRQKRLRAQDLLSKARKVLATDLKMAEALVADAAAIDPSVAPSADLLQCISARKRKISVDAALSSAEQLRKTGNLAAALLKMETAAREFPEEPQIDALRHSLDAELQGKRQAIMKELDRIKENGDGELSIPSLQTLRDRAFKIARDPNIETDLKSKAGEITLELDGNIKRLKRLHLWSEVAARRKPLMVGASITILLVVGWLAVPRILPVHEIPIRITAEDGVSVVVGGKSCVTPGCSLSLKPGTYSLTATQDGHEPFKQSLTLKPKQADISLSLSMAALPEIIQVNTNFAAGQVSIDSKKVGDLVNGGFLRAGIEPGNHTIEVNGGDVNFKAKWRSRRGGSPIIEPLVTKDLIATVVASVGTKAVIESTYPAQPINIDGSPAGKTSANPGAPSAVSLFKEGLREMAIGGRKTSLVVRPNPTVSVDLALDRNVGIILIETHPVDVSVSLNNRMYRTTGNGVLRIPLEVGRYVIRAQRDGFRALEPKTVDLAKGDQQIITFTLVPIAGAVEINGMPGSDVSIDGQKRAPIPSSQALRIEGLTPGNHQVEVAKDGYVPFRGPITIVDGQVKQLTITQIPMPATRDPEDVAWESIQNSDDPTELDKFIEHYPNGHHAPAVRARASQLRQNAEWRDLDTKNYDALARFILKYPNSSHVGDARLRLTEIEEVAWRAVDSKDELKVKEFVLKYPKSPHVEQARTIVKEIEDWVSLTKNNKDAVSRFIDSYPNGPHAETARSIVKQIDEGTVAKTQREVTTNSIRVALSRYESALTCGRGGAQPCGKKSISELQDVWPSASPDFLKKQKEQFLDAKTITVQMSQIGDVKIDGNSASVDCRRTVTFTPNQGRAIAPLPDTVHVTFAQAGSTWRIAAITH